MPTQLQLRRGNTAQTASFTGAIAEITVDTDKNTIVVHDGSTAGGHEISGSDEYARPHSNAAFLHANSAFTAGNTNATNITAAQTHANKGFDHSNSAFTAANTALATESGFNPFLLSGM